MKQHNPLSRFAGILLLFALIFTYNSCSKDVLNANDPAELAKALAGRWDWDESSSGSGNNPDAEPDAISLPTDLDLREYFYTETGGYSFEQKNAEGEVLSMENGTWSLDGSSLTISSNEGFNITYDISIADEQLTRTRIAREGDIEYWTRDRWSKRPTE